MNPVGSAAHFGAGALGRGLVVPRLVAAGWSVTMIDADEALVAALARARDYPLAVTDGKNRENATVSIVGAFLPGDPAVEGPLAAARLITTAVRRENLGRVAASLVAAWNRNGMPEAVAVVGCENVERVDAVLDAAFAGAGISGEQRARLILPRTVVDRICAADWPSGLRVTTEPFNELAIGAPVDIPGIDSVPDVDAQFARKRYLVNTFADASAVLGLARGHRTLAEAITDASILHEIAPLLAALQLHLMLAYGFERDSLESYLARSRRRLANAAIPRRLETVSRDFRRKLGPTERFAEPLIDLESRGRLDDDAVAVIASLVRAAMPDGTVNSVPARGEAQLSPPASRFYARLDAALAG